MSAARRRAERLILSAMLACLAACSTHRGARDVPVKEARESLARCFREQHLIPCAEHELQAMRDMNELLLRDIGAPDWMVANASMRRIDQLRGLK